MHIRKLFNIYFDIKILISYLSSDMFLHQCLVYMWEVFKMSIWPPSTFSVLFLNWRKLAIFGLVSDSNGFFEIITHFSHRLRFSNFSHILCLGEKKKLILTRLSACVLFPTSFCLRYCVLLQGFSRQHSLGSAVLFLVLLAQTQIAHTSVLFLKSLPRKSVQLVLPKHKLYYK